MKSPALIGNLSTFRALIPRPFSPTGCRLFFHREALLFGMSSSSLLLLLLFSFLGRFIHQQQQLACILNDAYIKLTLTVGISFKNEFIFFYVTEWALRN